MDNVIHCHNWDFCETESNCILFNMNQLPLTEPPSDDFNEKIRRLELKLRSEVDIFVFLYIHENDLNSFYGSARDHISYIYDLCHNSFCRFQSLWNLANCNMISICIPRMFNYLWLPQYFRNVTCAGKYLAMFIQYTYVYCFPNLVRSKYS